MFELIVYGNPAPQGSKRAVGRRRNGSTILVEQSRNVAPWRALVAAQARMRLEETNRLGVPFSGAVRASVDFTMPPPKRLPTGRVRPSVSPDLDKLARAILDALTAAGVWRDDGQVVSLILEEWYPGPPPALDSPGVRIRVEPAPLPTEHERALRCTHEH